jgi:hypothetical protein
MTVGWFDAGLEYLSAIEKNKAKLQYDCYGTMESWRLGRNGAKAVIGNINFGDISVFQKNIEAFFPRFLKDNGKEKTNYRKLMF